MSRIAVVTICTRDLNFRDYTIENSRDYCKRHGYDFLLYEDRIDPESAAISNKTICVLQNIDKYDWIFMKDADSLFYNFNFRLEDYIDENYNYIASMSSIPDTVNLGHLLIQCTPQSKKELEMVSGVIREKVVLKGEQPIFNDFWNEGKISSIKRLPKHVLNAQVFDKENHEEWTLTLEDLQKLDDRDINFEAHADVKSDTFIIHYPGAFLKSRSYLHERLVHTTGEADMFNFSEEYLPEFIATYNRIRQKFLVPDKIKTVSRIPYGVRVKKNQRKKIKYKNR